MDRGQMTLEGWSRNDQHFNPNNSLASFYGCQTLYFAELFLVQQMFLIQQELEVELDEPNLGMGNWMELDLIIFFLQEGYI